jgi:hypothetical protein
LVVVVMRVGGGAVMGLTPLQVTVIDVMDGSTAEAVQQPQPALYFALGAHPDLELHRRSDGM